MPTICTLPGSVGVVRRTPKTKNMVNAAEHVAHVGQQKTPPAPSPDEQWAPKGHQDPKKSIFPDPDQLKVITPPPNGLISTNHAWQQQEEVQQHQIHPLVTTPAPPHHGLRPMRKNHSDRLGQKRIFLTKLRLRNAFLGLSSTSRQRARQINHMTPRQGHHGT